MKNKTLILLLTSALLLSNSPLISAESKNDANDKRIEYLKIECSKHRPEKPARVFMECHYWKGMLMFKFPTHSDIRNVRVTICKDEAVIWMGNVTSENPEVAIPVLFGEYDITCRTDGNQIFKGKLNFE